MPVTPPSSFYADFQRSRRIPLQLHRACRRSHPPGRPRRSPRLTTPHCHVLRSSMATMNTVTVTTVIPAPRTWGLEMNRRRKLQAPDRPDPPIIGKRCLKQNSINDSPKHLVPRYRHVLFMYTLHYIIKCFRLFCQIGSTSSLQ